MGLIIVIVCSLTLSFGAAVGVNIQKLSMTKEEFQQGPHRPRPPYKQPLWCLGMAVIVLDAIGDFVFMGMAPQTLLAPLGSLGLGWNIILAPIFHTSERVTMGIITATGVIYIGTIITVLFAADSDPSYDLDQIVQFAKNPHFIEYFMLCLLFQFSMSYHGHKKGFGMVHYCSLAGCFGGQCVLFAKSSSELVKNMVIKGSTHDWTSSPLPYIFIIGMLGTVMTQMSFLNTGLAKFEALVVVPVYQSFWNAFSITGGLIFFQEYQYMTKLDAIMYSIGIAITLIGVVLLVRHRQRNLLPAHAGHIE